MWEGDSNCSVDMLAYGRSGIPVRGAWNRVGSILVCESIAICFEAHTTTAFGQVIYLLSSLLELGMQNPDNAIALSTDNYTLKDIL